MLVGPQVSILELLDFALDLLDGLPVTLLDPANELVTLPGNDVDIIVRQLPPLFANLSLQLHPLPIDCLRMHRVTFQYL